MALHVFWPASACLTLFVVGVIMILLKYGERICGRHRTWDSYKRNFNNDAGEGGYDLEISESVA